MIVEDFGNLTLTELTAASRETTPRRRAAMLAYLHQQIAELHLLVVQVYQTQAREPIKARSSEQLIPS